MEKLFSIPPDHYGDKYSDHLLEQYKVLVESADKISDRRLNTHKYFASLNVAILTALGLTLQFGNYESRIWVRLALGIAGMGISIVYWMLIRSYKNINSAKFKVIHQIEKKLPAAIYSAEWDELNALKDKHQPFSHLEILIPKVFGLGYAILVYWCVKIFIGRLL